MAYAVGGHSETESTGLATSKRLPPKNVRRNVMLIVLSSILTVRKVKKSVRRLEREIRPTIEGTPV